MVRYRRNADLSLREVERLYHLDKTPENRIILNRLRRRAGLDRVPPELRVFKFTEGWQVQSLLIENDVLYRISSATQSHDGWWGIHHVYWQMTDGEMMDLGDHYVGPRTATLVRCTICRATFECEHRRDDADVVDPARLIINRERPTQDEVIRAHLQVVNYVEDYGLASVKKYHRWEPRLRASFAHARHRANPDESLRELEREYLRTRDEAIKEQLRAARLRSGLPVPNLEFGYNAGLPLDAAFAWGARAIIERGTISLLPDRQSWYPQVQHPANELTLYQENELERLRLQLDRGPAPGSASSGGLISQARREAERLLRLHVMRPDERREFWLAESDLVVILGNTNASRGYLYIAAFIKPSGWVGPARYQEPPPPPKIEYAPEHARRLYDRVLVDAGHIEGASPFPQATMKIKPELAKLILESAQQNLKNKTGAKTVAAFFKWLLKQQLIPETRVALEKIYQPKKNYY